MPGKDTVVEHSKFSIISNLLRVSSQSGKLTIAIILPNIIYAWLRQTG